MPPYRTGLDRLIFAAAAVYDVGFGLPEWTIVLRRTLQTAGGEPRNRTS